MVNEKKNINKKINKSSDTSLAIIIGSIIIAIALLVNVSNFEISGSYIVGSSPNASLKSIICDKDNISNCAEVDLGALKTESRLVDNAKRSPIYSLMGVQQTDGRSDDIHVMFQFGLNAKQIRQVTSGTGTNGVDVNLLNIQSGNGSGLAQVSSFDELRYRPGHEGFVFFTVIFSPPLINSTQKAGLFDDDDGFYIGYNGTQFGISRLSGGVDFFTPQDEFNKDKLDGSGETGCNIDMLKNNVYRLSYAYLGILPINFEVYCNGGWLLFHTIDLTNSITTTNIENPSLPMRFEVNKTNVVSTQNIFMKSGSWNAGILTNTDTPGNNFAEQGSETVGSSLTNVLTIRSNETFKGRTNHVKTIFNAVSFASDGNKNVIISICKNAEFTTALNYTQVDINDSIMTFSDTTSLISNCNQLILSFQLSKIDSQLITEIDKSISINRNETFTIAAQSQTSSDVGASINWEELF